MKIGSFFSASKPIYCENCGRFLKERTVKAFDIYTGKEYIKELYLECPKRDHKMWQLKVADGLARWVEHIQTY